MLYRLLRRQDQLTVPKSKNKYGRSDQLSLISFLIHATFHLPSLKRVLDPTNKKRISLLYSFFLIRAFLLNGEEMKGRNEKKMLEIVATKVMSLLVDRLSTTNRILGLKIFGPNKFQLKQVGVQTYF